MYISEGINYRTFILDYNTIYDLCFYTISHKLFFLFEKLKKRNILFILENLIFIGIELLKYSISKLSTIFLN